MRASLAGLPAAKREALLPETSPLDVIVVGSDKASKSSIRPANKTNSFAFDAMLSSQLVAMIESENQSLERVGLFHRGLETMQESNSWVVSGKRTTSGKPLLANDPHIPAAAPGIWHQIELIAPGMHVEGVTFPGAPG